MIKIYLNIFINSKLEINKFYFSKKKILILKNIATLEKKILLPKKIFFGEKKLYYKKK